MSSKADIDNQRGSELGLLKSQTEEEFLVKIGAKEEEVGVISIGGFVTTSTGSKATRFEWDPRVMNERLRRSSSFVCPEYTKPACFRAKPKTISAVNPWTTNSQAVRQLCSVSRFGPKRFFINNQDIHQIGDQHLKGDTTQALGLCYQPMTVDNL